MKLRGCHPEPIPENISFHVEIACVQVLAHLPFFIDRRGDAA